jgi:ribosomal protein S27E
MYPDTGRPITVTGIGIFRMRDGTIAELWGEANIRSSMLAIGKCPRCGAEVEVFSNDVLVACGNCGFTVYNDLPLCVQ